MNTTAILATGTDISLKTDSQSLEQCLKNTYHFSYTAIQNICTGQSYAVPNGFWDYTLAFVLGGLGLGMLCLMLIALAMMISDI